SFTSSKSMQFFERFEINTDFLSLNPSEWYRNDDFSKGLMLVRIIKVVNDIGECALKLDEDYMKHGCKQYYDDSRFNEALSI
ncbi:hypothetical protein PV325_007336, partial [Microctonus aethiopoides]